jgi:hypothetical protein
MLNASGFLSRGADLYMYLKGMWRRWRKKMKEIPYIK